MGFKRQNNKKTFNKAVMKNALSEKYARAYNKPGLML
jgi:hypothetical protein